MDVDRCVMCGEAIPEGMQVCPECADKITGKDEAEQLRDIADVLKITAGTDKNIKDSMEAILRIADRLERKTNMSVKLERTEHERELQTKGCACETENRRKDGTERKREVDWTWFYRARFSKHY